MKTLFLNKNALTLKYFILQFKVLSNIAFIFALIYCLVVMSSIPGFYAPQSPSILISQSPLVPETDPLLSPMNFQLIKEWHLFGDTTSAGIVEGQMMATSLQIKLLGVFYLPNQPNNSYAIIESEDKTQKKYHQGDELNNGSILQSIEKEQVILLHNQQTELLTIDRNRIGLLLIPK